MIKSLQSFFKRDLRDFYLLYHGWGKVYVTGWSHIPTTCRIRSKISPFYDLDSFSFRSPLKVCQPFKNYNISPFCYKVVKLLETLIMHKLSSKVFVSKVLHGESNRQTSDVKFSFKKQIQLIYFVDKMFDIQSLVCNLRA